MTDAELIGKIIGLYAPIFPEFSSPSWIITTPDDEKNEYIYKCLKARRQKELRFGYKLGNFFTKFLFIAIVILIVLGLTALIKALGTYLFF